MSGRLHYLDYAASAPLRSEALDAQARYRSLPHSCANPNSLHTLGRQAAASLGEARRVLAAAVGGGFRAGDVVFTSGGTESNNLAVYGIAEGARAADRRRTRVVISAIEHDSVLDLAPSLRHRGFDVDIAPARRDGTVDLDALSGMVDESCALVSVMCANNETGVIQPVARIAALCRAHGVPFHTDAVQAFGRIPIEVGDVSAVSVAGHKIGAPLGTGALLLRGRCPFRPQGFGGGQESGRRPGTQDVCGAVTFAEVARIVMTDMPRVRQVVAARAQGLYDRLCAPGTGIVPTTSAIVDEGRLPSIVSIMVEGCDSESLLLRLDAAGYEVSAGSACSSASLDPSHVLSAMGIPRDLAFGSLRISFDERVDEGVLAGFADTLLTIAKDLRR